MVITFVMTYVFRNVKALNKLEPEYDEGGLAMATAGGAGSGPAVSVMDTKDASTAVATPDMVTQEMIYAPVEGEVIMIGEGPSSLLSKMMGDGFMG